MDPTSKTHPGSPASVPPYEPNPAYTQQPHMQHQDSYNNTLIQPHHQQQQYPEQQQYPQQAMASPPAYPPKQEYYSAQPHQMQQQQPVQQAGYQTAIPLANLEDVAAPADCPRCHMRALTVIQSHSGNTTHAWAFVLCICLCLGCIPYIISALKDVEHKCGHCGVPLATYRRSGRTVVHQHA